MANFAPQIKSLTSRSSVVAHRTYHAHAFTLAFPESWQDKTVFMLTGPVEHGIQHCVLVNVEPETPFATAWDYADHQIAALEGELKGCRCKQMLLAINALA